MNLKRVLPLALLLVVAIAFGRFFLLRPETLTPVFIKKETALTVPEIEPGKNESPSTLASHGTLLNDQEKLQLQVFYEILKSKNDNDSRFDTTLKNLSAEVKLALEKQYHEMKPELRNERGTIAFLIGREMAEGRGTVKDVEFIRSILLEKPCLSLSDCSKAATGQTVEEQHLEAINETTGNYPQLMSLREMKQTLDRGNLSDEMKNSVIAALEACRNSPNPRVVQEAQTILSAHLH